jgi:hypothetical protein
VGTLSAGTEAGTWAVVCPSAVPEGANGAAAQSSPQIRVCLLGHRAPDRTWMAMAALRKIGGCTLVSFVLLSCAGWVQDRRIGAGVQRSHRGTRRLHGVDNGQVALSCGQAGTDIGHNRAGFSI